MIIIFVGPPGSGKGTQAKLFVKEGWLQLSTGDMFRNLKKDNTPFAKEVKEIMASGILISDEITSKLLKISLEKLLKHEKNIILDGYPRTIKQVGDLKNILKDLGLSVDYVVNFETSYKILINRLTNRWMCPTCGMSYHSKFMPPINVGICDNDETKLVQRDDDKKEKIKIRFETFERLTKPVINFYKKENKIVTVNGEFDSFKINKYLKEKLK